MSRFLLYQLAPGRPCHYHAGPDVPLLVAEGELWDVMWLSEGKVAEGWVDRDEGGLCHVGATPGVDFAYRGRSASGKFFEVGNLSLLLLLEDVWD
jgi:hypothetical protein